MHSLICVRRRVSDGISGGLFSRFSGRINLGLSLAFLMVATLTMGCTRKLDQAAHITISLPDHISTGSSNNKLGSKAAAVNTAGTAYLAHAAVNVSASDIAAIVQVWDNHGGTAT